MEDQTVDQFYKKGFEIGYWLKRGSNPHLKDIIHNNNNGGRYHSGLVAGSKEATRELLKERMAEIDKANEKDKEKGMDIG